MTEREWDEWAAATAGQREADARELAWEAALRDVRQNGAETGTGVKPGEGRSRL